MSNSHKVNTMSEDKKISRSKFLSSMGALGVLGTVPFLATGCKEPMAQPVVFEGENQDAIIKNIMSRRAIRKYTEQQPTQEQIDTIMKCAIHAPSSANGQPWEVRVILKPEMLKEINGRWVKENWSKKHTGLLAGHREEGFSIFYGAPVLIVISADPKNNKARTDVGLMMQNILLSAHALGLGTCPIGALVGTLSASENRDILDVLNIPDGYEVMANVALGYPGQTPEATIRYSDKVKIIR